MALANILLVDDDVLLLQGLALKLNQAGYAATLASNAEDGLVLTHEHPPDIVLLDIELPGMDGWEALQQIKRVANIPVIFLSAHRQATDQMLGLELGAMITSSSRLTPMCSWRASKRCSGARNNS